METQKIFAVIAQKVAEAIEAVVNIDVTVMDSNMVRIAGTGIYKDRIGLKIEEQTAFGYALKTGRHYVVETARESEICAVCERRVRCSEKAEVCMPLKRGDVPIGVIGVIAFTDEQRDKIVRNKAQYINFIQKMAELLEAKLSEERMSRENQLLALRLKTILNTMQEALVVFNRSGEILYRNDPLNQLLTELSISDSGGFLTGLWDELKEKALNREVVENRKIRVRFHGQVTTLVASVYTMDAEGSEFIVKLHEFIRFEKKMIRYTQQNQVNVDFDSILTVSESLLDTKATAAKAAESDSNVLIYGESGTGKELFARAIHNRSKRRDNAFIAINCGAIPDELLESELFGHEKGAFTGAINTRIGKFEGADEGTLFLDEISEMPYALQVKLLRVLQEKEICRVGSNETRKIDIRIIAATNADLRERIEESTFREDLYYRLNIIPIHIPPLRERVQDIIYLSQFYIGQYNLRFDKSVKRLSKNAEALFTAHAWPGNVRELQNILEYAVNFETGDEIHEDLIKRRLAGGNNRLKGAAPAAGLPLAHPGATLSSDMDRVEKELIQKTIDAHSDLKHKEIVKNACKDLNISRTTLYRRLRKHAITIPRFKNAPSLRSSGTSHALTSSARAEGEGKER
ncbi:sigma 54-interacting transcriptional regulator [Desulfoluna butyratoxydans]|uniref:Bacterial regulatory protein fis family n=1 Tax=Desulfoluna butyratoxydans TaxID=231438 RepID=A0A4U8YJC3_9BACT|nr:sigma 54-interacting transcriptional regulator [Desulfoluna butyratoxydans]VFQ43139.1 bacterial regulatory protein fis family [Desulfoluna butyratoxydans]